MGGKETRVNDGRLIGVWLRQQSIPGFHVLRKEGGKAACLGVKMMGSVSNSLSLSKY